MHKAKALSIRLAIGLNSFCIVKPKQLLSLIRRKDLYRHRSYYPEVREEQHKRSHKIFWEQVHQILKYDYPNEYYFSYGMDVKNDDECNQYLNYMFFRNRRENLNFANKVNCTCILRDKMLFSIFANGIGVRTAPNVYYSTNGSIYEFDSKREVTVSELTGKDCELFCKLVDGECGNGVFKLKIKEGQIFINNTISSVDELQNRISSGRFLFQEVIRQHPDMSALHSQSINSMRLITVRSLKDGHIYTFPSILRIGTGNSIVDNTSQGGLAVGIDMSTGFLKKWGFYKPQFGLKVDTHPDSKVKFSDFRIPFFKEAVQQAIYFHSMLPELHSVGWDIAIDEEGPIFIEGNDNWEINGPQICNGGLKENFNNLFYK